MLRADRKNGAITAEKVVASQCVEYPVWLRKSFESKIFGSPTVVDGSIFLQFFAFSPTYLVLFSVRETIGLPEALLCPSIFMSFSCN